MRLVSSSAQSPNPGGGKATVRFMSKPVGFLSVCDHCREYTICRWVDGDDDTMDAQVACNSCAKARRLVDVPTKTLAL